MNQNSFEISAIIFLIVTTIALSAAGMQQAVNLLFLGLCPMLMVNKRKLLLFIYIVYLPTNGFIGTEYNFLGIFHVSYIINFFASLAAYIEWNSLSSATREKIHKSMHFYKPAVGLIVFLFLYVVLTEYRLFFLGMSDISTQLLVNRTLRHFMMFFPLIILIYLSVIDQYQSIVRKGFIFSVVIIALTTIFSGHLYSLGVEVRGSFEDLYGLDIRSEHVRSAGVASLGGLNTAANFLVLGFSFVLLLNKKYINLSIKYLILAIIIVALALTASRSAFISLFLVVIFFIIFFDIKLNTKILYCSIISIVATAVYAGGLLEFTLHRFSEISMGEGLLDPYNIGGRLGGWIFYLEYIFSDLKILFFGTTENIYDVYRIFLSTSRVAHNYFIQLTYYWGIFALFIFIIIFFKLIIKLFFSKYRNALIIFLIPVLIIVNTVSSHYILIFFVIALLSLPVINKEQHTN